MYVIEYRRSGPSELHEMTAREYREATASERDGFRFKRVAASYAHDWVKEGRLHNTGLWIDPDGRVRKAKPNL